MIPGSLKIINSQIPDGIYPASFIPKTQMLGLDTNAQKTKLQPADIIYNTQGLKNIGMHFSIVMSVFLYI
jgi:hypothetical protein